MFKKDSVYTLLALFVCISILLFTSACNHSTPSVNTTSYINSQVGTTITPIQDMTAVTAINIFSGNTSGCFASGGSQPPSPPLDSGWASLGTSPGPGQCKFSGYAPGTWDFEFFSGQCAVVGQPLGQPFDFQGFLTTDSNGFVSHTVCQLPASAAPAAGSHFALSNALPSAVTVSAPGLTTTYGMPQLLVYDRNLSLRTTVNASSTSVDGSNATFPFPALAGGMYMFAVKNLAASGQYKVVDATHFSIGGANVLAGAFGIDAAEVTTRITVCSTFLYKTTCNTSAPAYSPIPILTQYYANQVTYNGATIPVGLQPVAVKFYRAYTTITTSTSTNIKTTTYTTRPANAIVVNSGSNSVSIVDLKTSADIKDIAVGTQPMAITLDSGATHAYVANYGSGTLSEVDLSTQTVSRTASIVPGLQSVAMDPSGSYVWVGGTNDLYEVNLSTFTVAATYPVNGSVTSMAVSTAQNRLAYTLVQNCCASSSTYSANNLSLINVSTTGTFAQTTASPYALYTMNGTLPIPVLPQATYISAQFGNGVAASSTPTGFVIYDLVSNQQLMTGTTPTPIRGIASDPLNRIVYLTVPDSNEYLAVPLPY